MGHERRNDRATGHQERGTRESGASPLLFVVRRSHVLQHVSSAGPDLLRGFSDDVRLSLGPRLRPRPQRHGGLRRRRPPGLLETASDDHEKCDGGVVDTMVLWRSWLPSRPPPFSNDSAPPSWSVTRFGGIFLQGAWGKVPRDEYVGRDTGGVGPLGERDKRIRNRFPSNVVDRNIHGCQTDS